MSRLRELAKSSLIISAFTMLSRVLGLIRDMLRAEYFGVGPLAKAFVIAFRIPNILRNLVAEGALSQAFIPVFADSLKSSPDEKAGKERAFAMANAVISIASLILIGIVLLGEMFSPWIVHILSAEWTDSSNPTTGLTTELTRIMFPYLFFVSIASLFMGILNTFKHFAAPALSPVVLNLTVIAAYLLIFPVVNEPTTQIRWLAGSVVLGGAFQLLMQIIAAYRTGYRFRFSFDWHHPAIKKIFTVMLPAVFGAGVYQINQILDLMIAAYIETWRPGAVASLEYASRLMQLPLGVFGVATATALLPALSLLLAENKISEYRDTLREGYTLVAFISFPAMAGLVLLAEGIIRLLLERGAFDSYSTSITVWPLVFYSFGIFTYSCVKITVSAFFSLKDSKTPVYTALFVLIFNVSLSLILMRWLDHAGLALAATIGSLIHWALLLFFLRRKLGLTLELHRLFVPMLKIILATTLMALSLWFISQWNHPIKDFLVNDFFGKFFVLLEIMVGAGVYVIAAIVLRIEAMHELIQLLKRRRRK